VFGRPCVIIITSRITHFHHTRLNVVVGPNGTGKSTILCAICLGLGGQPPLLGRADDARLFIKHEKDEATVEIELAPLEGKPVHVFKRVIDRAKGSESGKGAGEFMCLLCGCKDASSQHTSMPSLHMIGASAYFINGHKATLKDLKKIVTEVYKISIDNLCTFLPQDKVGNFSGFDKQALLIETEKSLSEHLYNTHMDLIKLEKELGDSGNNADQVQADLDEEMKQNAKLEDELKKLEEREGLIERVELLKMKRTWMIFDAKREETKLLKEMRESLKKQKKEAERGMKPIAEKHAEMEGEVNRIKSRYNTLEKKLKQDRKTFDDCNSKSANYGDAIENAMAEYQNIEAEQRRAERELEKQRARLEDLETEFKEFPDAAELEKEIAVSQRELRDTKKKIDDIKRRMRDLAEDSEVATNRRDNAARELEKVKDEKKIRLNRLFGVAKNLQEAYQFVDQNRKMFRRPVWGPVGAEVQPKSEAAAAFLEQHVSNASWKAFVVECKEDYDLLYREIRQKRKIPINIITVPVGGKLDKVDRPYSKEKFEVLKREHGFEYYLDESFTAPDAIVAALQVCVCVCVGRSNWLLWAVVLISTSFHSHV
jgi:chromosome segregation ATPase